MSKQDATIDAAYVIPDPLLDRCMGQVELVKRVLRVFIDQIERDVPQLSDSILSEDEETAASLAHRMKGSAANVAAEPLRVAAESLEQSAREGRMRDARDCLQRFESEWQSYLEKVTTFLS